jgi:hypothetical protein
LIDILKDSKQMVNVQVEAINALRRIGPEAKEALPLLSDFMRKGAYFDECMRAVAAIQAKSP